MEENEYKDIAIAGTYGCKTFTGCSSIDITYTIGKETTLQDIINALKECNDFIENQACRTIYNIKLDFKEVKLLGDEKYYNSKNYIRDDHMQALCELYKAIKSSQRIINIVNMNDDVKRMWNKIIFRCEYGKEEASFTALIVAPDGWEEVNIYDAQGKCDDGAISNTFDSKITKGMIEGLIKNECHIIAFNLTVLLNYIKENAFTEEAKKYLKDLGWEN